MELAELKEQLAAWIRAGSYGSDHMRSEVREAKLPLSHLGERTSWDLLAACILGWKISWDYGEEESSTERNTPFWVNGEGGVFYPTTQWRDLKDESTYHGAYDLPWLGCHRNTANVFCKLGRQGEVFAGQWLVEEKYLGNLLHAALERPREMGEKAVAFACENFPEYHAMRDELRILGLPI